MKRLLVTTALAAVLATPVMAAGSGQSDQPSIFLGSAGKQDIHASDFIGSRVYVSDKKVTDTSMKKPGADWKDVGEINDVLFTPDGQIDSILVDVGGFLGIGEKTVAIGMDSLELVSDGNSLGDYFVVFTSSRKALENAPAFKDDTGHSGMSGSSADKSKSSADTSTASADNSKNSANMSESGTDKSKNGTKSSASSTDKSMSGADTSATGKATGQTAAGTTAATGAGQTAAGYPAAPNIQRDNYKTVVAGDLKVKNLTGATVYDTNDKNIGSISDVILDADGKAKDAVIDVGGFLGIGAKPVKLSFDSLTIKKAEQSGDIRVYIGATEQQLKDMPEYQG